MRQHTDADNAAKLGQCPLGAFPLAMRKFTAPCKGLRGIHLCKLTLLKLLSAFRHTYFNGMAAFLRKESFKLLTFLRLIGNIYFMRHIACITVTADLKRGANAMRMTSRISRMLKDEIPLSPGVETELGGAHEFDAETLPPIAAGLSISLVIIFFFILVNFRKFGITLVVMASMSLCLFGAMVGLWIADFTIGLTSVLGFITLLGMIVRNVILMYQHAEDKRKVCHWSGKLAAYDAGKRRMVPIFLTTATTAVGVVPMMLGGSTFWAPVGITIFAGGIGSLILVVTILPVLYSKIYK